jgi:hypothetical protein
MCSDLQKLHFCNKIVLLNTMSLYLKIIFDAMEGSGDGLQGILGFHDQGKTLVFCSFIGGSIISEKPPPSEDPDSRFL